MCRQLLTPQGILSYEIQSNTISILSYEGNDHYLVIPEIIENYFVTGISPKAFLGKRQIEQLVLPSKTTCIGDWAFAHMTALKTLTIPSKDIALGKQVFLDCPMLAEIKVYDLSSGDPVINPDTSPVSQDPALPFYLATVIMTLKNSFLFLPACVGKQNWYEDFDEAVCHFLDRPDDEGFEPVYLGWFEDEDVMATQYPIYTQKKRMEKAALSLKRLRFPYALNDDFRKLYENYIISHLETGVWELLCTPLYAADCSYFKILTDLGAIRENNIDRFLADLNRQGACEAVAVLLHYKETHLKKEDFWQNLDL